MNRRQIIAVGVLVVALITGTWAVARVQESNDNTYSNIERFIQVLTKVRDNYVEPVSSDKLMDAAIRGMLRTLDPYSQYLYKDEAERLETTTHGAFGGIGISIGMRDRWVTVIAPIEGTPAWKAGILGGDRIIKIDEVSTEGLSLDDAMKKMRGERGTHVKLTIFREGREKPMDFDIVRDIIQIKSVPYAGMLSNGVGYVRLSNFSERSRQEMDAAFDKLEKMNPHGVIIDLRYNPGGLLSQAVEVAEEFTPRGKKVVYTRGRDSSQNRDFYSTAEHTHDNYPIVILVNQWTASASEIVSGALQDLDLGLVVGKTTFGKGLVQTVIPLTRSVKGPKLKLTTAKYYTPSGRSIHKDENDHPHEADEIASLTDGGSDVDNVAPDAPDTKSDANGELKEVKDAKEKPVFYTSSGRVVYGGGGITPDLEFNPREYTEMQRTLEKDYLGFSFAMDYLKKHNDVKQDFTTTDAVLSDFYKFLDTKKFQYKKEELTPENVDYIRTMVAREVVNAKFGRNAMYKVVVDQDPEVKEVLQMLDKHPTLKSLFAYGVEEKDSVKKAAKPDEKPAPKKK